MSQEHKTATELKEGSPEPVASELGKVGARSVGPIGIVLMMVYLSLLTLFLLYSLVQFWLPTSPAEGATLLSSDVTFLFWNFPVSGEVRLLLIVALSGALGSLAHALRSLYWYIGNRTLLRSWLPMYILLPFVGTTLVARSASFARNQAGRGVEP